MHYGMVAVMQDLIGTTEAVDILKVDKATITRWVAAGKLTPVTKLPRKNGAFIFNRADVEALAATA
jgi:predicted site-specific integrase-resolvase